jgi:hypothetical protein
VPPYYESEAGAMHEFISAVVGIIAALAWGLVLSLWSF